MPNWHVTGRPISHGHWRIACPRYGTREILDCPSRSRDRRIVRNRSEGWPNRHGFQVLSRNVPICGSSARSLPATPISFFTDVVSQIGGFAIAGLVAEQTCLATAIDASHRGHHVTFLSDASVSRGRHDADARAVHVVTTKAIELFADTVTTRDWLVGDFAENPQGASTWMKVRARCLNNVISVLLEQRKIVVSRELRLPVT